MVALNEIRDFAQRVAQEFRPQRIILFGSHASGEPTPDSDVDLMVVMPFSGKSWTMATEIRNRVRRTFPMDLIVRTPQQVEERLSLGDPFLVEITTHGKVLYEADHG